MSPNIYRGACLRHWDAPRGNHSSLMRVMSACHRLRRDGSKRRISILSYRSSSFPGRPWCGSLPNIRLAGAGMRKGRRKNPQDLVYKIPGESRRDSPVSRRDGSDCIFEVLIHTAAESPAERREFIGWSVWARRTQARSAVGRA